MKKQNKKEALKPFQIPIFYSGNNWTLPQIPRMPQ